MYPEQVNNNYEFDGVFLYGLQGTSFYKETKENKVMKQLIDKAALVAEMEERIKGLKDCHADTVPGYAGEISGLKRLLSFLDTLKMEELWKPADDLPEIDREVIALIPAYDGWKVVFAHRPDPVGYYGKSILSDEYKHFLPETYDGWNIPNIKWWLDLDLPKTDK